MNTDNVIPFGTPLLGDPIEQLSGVFTAPSVIKMVWTAYLAGKYRKDDLLAEIGSALSDHFKADPPSQDHANLNIASLFGELLRLEKAKIKVATIAETADAELDAALAADLSVLLDLPHGASVAVYTDGACKVNPGPAGCAFIVVFEGKAIYARSRHLGGGTNNIAELSAAIDALEVLAPRLDLCTTIHSDAKYVVDGITSWIKAWKRRGWRTTSGPVANPELWQKLDDLASTFPALSWQWVKGHNGDRFNEMVDALANKAAATPLP